MLYIWLLKKATMALNSAGEHFCSRYSLAKNYVLVYTYEKERSPLILIAQCKLTSCEKLLSDSYSHKGMALYSHQKWVKLLLTSVQKIIFSTKGFDNNSETEKDWFAVVLLASFY
mgnify:CR=1 FL=1